MRRFIFFPFLFAALLSHAQIVPDVPLGAAKDKGFPHKKDSAAPKMAVKKKAESPPAAAPLQNFVYLVLSPQQFNNLLELLDQSEAPHTEVKQLVTYLLQHAKQIKLPAPAVDSSSGQQPPK